MANNNNDKKKNLYYLNELSDYKISGDDPDVRGWQVKDADNRVIGKVDNLLVNKTTERVVYLDVEVDSTIIEADHDPYGKPADSDVHEFINKDGENHIIIPVGLVSINRDPDYVYTDRINHQTFAETKRIQKGSSINREYEVVVLESYGRNRDDHDRNRDSAFDNDRNRNVGTGGDRTTGSSFDNDRNRDSNFNNDRNRDSSFDNDRNRDNDVHGTVERRRVGDEDYSSSSNRGNLGSDSGRRDDDLDRDRDRRYSDDDSFYSRREFDDSNYRRKR